MSKLVALAELAHLSERPLPTAPDGRYDSQLKGPTEQPKESSKHSALYNIHSIIQNRVEHGPLIKDPNFLSAAMDILKNPDNIDDRKNIFTTLLGALCQLPQDSDLSKKLNDLVITVLYKTLPHPPAAYVGTDVPSSVGTSVPPPYGKGPAVDAKLDGKPTSGATPAYVPRMPFEFRSADGSNNNPLAPEMGKAGTSYARTVQAKHALPRNTLPDAGLVFDTLLKARDWKVHPNGNSSLTFAFASLVTHQLFRTDPRDFTKNNTSSYLDLSILYGNSQDQQDQIRNKELGRGLLYPDCFAEDRLILVPPAASALLVILSRNHNYVADMVLKINERGRWSSPPPTDPVKCALQDEEIFQIARNVNCGHFMSMIFGDYVAGFLGLGRDGSSWSMNPFDPIKDKNGYPVTRGDGNQCSVEFNVLYRWHATTARDDVKWVENIFNDAFGGKDLSTLDLKDFVPAVSKAWRNVDPNPRTRTFAGLQRGPNGKFSDDDIARVLHNAVENPAGAYRARGTPTALRLIEIVGMEQARSWGVCTLNEFRKYLGLRVYENFEEWSSDPAISDAAKHLYGHIDNLELYPGLQAEDPIPIGPGNGLCAGYTMTRAILADAICLVRGDRFFTDNYTPANLTTWGFQDCARNPNNGAFGAALPKLLLRHLPRHYAPNSTYALFPFFTPDVTETNLSNLAKKGIIKSTSLYNFNRPKTIPPTKVVDTLMGIRHVFNDYTKFKTVYGDDMRMMMSGYGFFLVFDEQHKHDTDKSILWHAMFPDKATIDTYTAWYKQKTGELIKEWSYKLDGVPGTRVDIIRNVVNLVSVHWASNWVIGLPLKDKSNPKGLFTEQEAYDIYTLMFMCVLMNVVPEHGFTLRAAAKPIGDIVNQCIFKSINEAAPKTARNPIAGIFSAVSSLFWPAEEKLCYPFLARLAQCGRPIEELGGQVLGSAIGSTVTFAQSCAQVVDFYLDDERAPERAKIISLVHRDDRASLELLKGYVREGQRLNPQFAALPRIAVAADTIPLGSGRPPLQVQPGDPIFASFRNAQLNPDDFPNPRQVDPTRPAGIYQNQGAGFHNCPGIDFSVNTIAEMLKVIFRLKNIRRAPGKPGNMTTFMQDAFGTDNKMYVTDTGGVSPWPSSLTIIYDE